MPRKTRGPGRYRVRLGTHVEEGKTYRKGEIVDSQEDLDAQNLGKPRGQWKYEWCGPSSNEKNAEDGLSVQEFGALKALAKSKKE